MKEDTQKNAGVASHLQPIVRRIMLYEMVRICARESEFVKCFDKLTMSNLSLKGSGLDLMIDEATGKQNDDIAKFIDFVDEFVFQRLPPLNERDA